MMQRRDVLLGLGAMGSLPWAAQAQGEWPNKPVKMVVAFAPGGPVDIVGRLISQRLADRLKQAMVIENRGGAGGNVGAQAIARAEPDGYTMLVTSSAFAVNPSLTKNAGYDPLKDFAPVNVVAASPNLLVAASDFPANNLKDVLKMREPLSYASAGTGTTPHLAAEYLFKSLAKMNVVHAPYNGAGPAITAVAGKQVPLGCVAVPAALELVKAGRVKPLAVTSPKRVRSLPDVPTVAELGYPGFSFNTWVGILAPARTPARIIDRMNSEINLQLFIPEFQDTLEKAGFFPVGGSVTKTAEYIKLEVQKYVMVVKQTGATAG